MELRKLLRQCNPCAMGTCIVHNIYLLPMPPLPFSPNPDPDEPESEFEGMYRQAQAFGDEALSRFDPENMPIAREDVRSCTDAIVNDLRRVVEAEQHGSRLGPLPYLVNDAWRTLADAIPDLRDSYEVEGTEVLEEIQSKLAEWLSDRGYTAGYKSDVPQPEWLRNLPSP